MPEERKQLNFKLDAEASARWDEVLERAQRALGIQLSQAQLVGLALKALEAQYASEDKKPKTGHVRPI